MNKKESHQPSVSYHCRSALRIKSVHFRILSAIILEWVQLPVAWVQSVHFALSDWFKCHKISGRLKIGWSFDNTQITIVLHKKSTFLDNEIALRIANRAIIKAVTKRIALRWISHIHEIKESCMNFVAISSVGVDRKYVELLWAKNQKYIDEKISRIPPKKGVCYKKAPPIRDMLEQRGAFL